MIPLYFILLLFTKSWLHFHNFLLPMVTLQFFILFVFTKSFLFMANLLLANLVSNIVTPIMVAGFALIAPVKHFLMVTSTFKIFIHSFMTILKWMNPVRKYTNDYSILTLNPPPNFELLLFSLMTKNFHIDGF